MANKEKLECWVVVDPSDRDGLSFMYVTGFKQFAHDYINECLLNGLEDASNWVVRKFSEDKEEDYSEWPEWANYRATDGDGQSWFFECLPSVNACLNQFEVSSGQASLIVENFPGWQDSLVERVR